MGLHIFGYSAGTIKIKAKSERIQGADVVAYLSSKTLHNFSTTFKQLTNNTFHHGRATSTVFFSARMHR
jgi:hypothetical protein